MNKELIERRLAKAVRAWRGLFKQETQSLADYDDWVENHICPILEEAQAAVREECCRAVKPFEPDGADEIELAIRSLDPSHDAAIERIRQEAVKEAVDNCLRKRDAEWAKSLGWPDIAERNGPMYPDDVRLFLSRRDERAIQPYVEKLAALEALAAQIENPACTEPDCCPASELAVLKVTADHIRSIISTTGQQAIERIK